MSYQICYHVTELMGNTLERLEKRGWPRPLVLRGPMVFFWLGLYIPAHFAMYTVRSRQRVAAEHPFECHHAEPADRSGVQEVLPFAGTAALKMTFAASSLLHAVLFWVVRRTKCAVPCLSALLCSLCSFFPARTDPSLPHCCPRRCSRRCYPLLLLPLPVLSRRRLLFGKAAERYVVGMRGRWPGATLGWSRSARCAARSCWPPDRRGRSAGRPGSSR